MDQEEFERLLRLGLGRAVLYLQGHDARPFRAATIEACQHNQSHDAQVEGPRSEYALDLIRASHDEAFYVEEVLRSLAESAGNHDKLQRFRLARLLAQNGDSAAREAMRSAFLLAPSMMSDLASEFVELDGVDGLLFVVGEIGEQLSRDADRWEDDNLLSVAKDLCGREAVETALTRAAQRDKRVRRYLNAVEESEKNRSKGRDHNAEALTYDTVRALIEAGQANGRLAEWSRTAADSDLERAARDLIQETDLKKLRSYLLLFRTRRFPLDCDHLLRLARLNDGPVPRHALSALKNIEDPRIRDMVFDFIRSQSSKRGYAIDLLIRNFRGGDHAVVEDWCKAESDPSTLNAFDRSVRSFFSEHPNPEVEVRLLKHFYENDPCAHCRCSVVERLLEMGQLPDALRDECRFDSYPETRDLVANAG